MQIKSATFVVFLAVSFLFAANAFAQPLPDGPYSPYSGQNYPPGYPGTDYLGPGYPGPDSGQSAYSNQGGTSSSHPTSGPQSYQPTSTPSASSTGALSFGQGETLTQQEVMASGNMESSRGLQATGSGQVMAYAMVTGLQLLVYYNGAWTMDPAAVYYYGSTSLVTNNDQAQTIWAWEKYPNGQQYWQNWGYRYPGYIHGRFIGDARGWHQLAMWGSQSGWSNVVWIYVW